EENDIIKIVANLPYYISSPIIRELLTAERYFERMIFMVQKEVAGRMVAAPESGDFGLLSVAVQFYSRVEIIHEVSPSVFIPRPEVDSCIIRLSPYQQAPYQVADENYFFRVVKAIFQLRRKNIKNALTGASTLNISKDKVLEALKRCEIDPRLRGEKLNIKKMVQLSNQMYQLDK
ncbi:MAG: ribosomal RNA small subunit methyltransferase A, partial [Halanaerobiaceae bacterium]